MSGGLTGVAAKAALDYLSGRSLNLGTVPQAVSLALLTAAPPDDPSEEQLQEVSATGYFRQQVAFSAATVPAAGQPAQIGNSGNVLFGPFTDVNGLSFPATHCALISSIPPTDTSDLVDANTAGMETDASGWQVETNCTLDQSTVHSKSGLACLEMVVPALGEATASSVASYPAIPSMMYALTAWSFSTVAGVHAQIDVDFLGSDASEIGSSTGVAVSLGANSWTEISAVVTAPADAVSLRPILHSTTTADGQSVFYDSISIVPVSVETVLMTWQFDAMGQAAQNESLQLSAGALSMSLG